MNGTIVKGFVNYPSVASSQAYIQSTWADITFYDAIREENANSICQKMDRSISSDKSAILYLSLNRRSVDENDEKDSVLVNGTLASLLNGKGINDTVGYGIIDSGGNRQTDNGKFDSQVIPTSTLPSGAYKVFVKPQSSQYQGLQLQSDLIVNPHVPTIEETVGKLGTYIGVAATIIGVIAFLPQIRGHYSGKMQRRNMAEELNKIFKIFDKAYTGPFESINLENAVKNLVNERGLILTMYKDGQISQEHYTLLDNKISEYIGKLEKDKSVSS